MRATRFFRNVQALRERSKLWAISRPLTMKKASTASAPAFMAPAVKREIGSPASEPTYSAKEWDQTTKSAMIIRMALKLFSPDLISGVRLALLAIVYPCRPYFWMQKMKPLRRRNGNQYMHRGSLHYRDLVKRKLRAYHAFIQARLIAQGLL